MQIVFLKQINEPAIVHVLILRLKTEVYIYKEFDLISYFFVTFCCGFQKLIGFALMLSDIST